jgi:hypothetical protein
MLVAEPRGLDHRWLLQAQQVLHDGARANQAVERRLEVVVSSQDELR